MGVRVGVRVRERVCVTVGWSEGSRIGAAYCVCRRNLQEVGSNGERSQFM